MYKKLIFNIVSFSIEFPSKEYSSIDQEEYKNIRYCFINYIPVIISWKCQQFERFNCLYVRIESIKHLITIEQIINGMMNWIATTIEQIKIALLILSLYTLVINLLWVNCILYRMIEIWKKKFSKREKKLVDKKFHHRNIIYVKHSIFFRIDNTPFNLLISLLYIYHTQFPKV